MRRLTLLLICATACTEPSVTTNEGGSTGTEGGSTGTEGGSTGTKGGSTGTEGGSTGTNPWCPEGDTAGPPEQLDCSGVPSEIGTALREPEAVLAWDVNDLLVAPAAAGDDFYALTLERGPNRHTLRRFTGSEFEELAELPGGLAGPILQHGDELVFVVIEPGDDLLAAAEATLFTWDAEDGLTSVMPVPLPDTATRIADPYGRGRAVLDGDDLYYAAKRVDDETPPGLVRVDLASSSFTELELDTGFEIFVVEAGELFGFVPELGTEEFCCDMSLCSAQVATQYALLRSAQVVRDGLCVEPTEASARSSYYADAWVRAGGLYFATDYQLRRIPLEGGPESTILRTERWIIDAAVDDAGAYIVARSSGETPYGLIESPLDGAGPRWIAELEEPSGTTRFYDAPHLVGLTPGHVYVQMNGEESRLNVLLRFPREGA